jgi:dolichol-phosphate mannosyltransferase
MIKASIISPVYNSERIVKELVKRISESITLITPNYEIVLVEDGSSDESWEAIESECKKNQLVKGIKLSRNFGQHYAISAGIKYASGDILIIIDCDLQDDPKYFNELVDGYNKGYDIVYTIRKQRNFSFFKNVTAKCFYQVFNYLVDNKSLKGSEMVGSYSLISRKVADSFNKIYDYRRHYLMILRWLGFRHTFVEVEHTERFEGKSSYNIVKLISHALDGIVSNSNKVLKITAVSGLVLSITSFIIALVIIISYIISPFQAGWASLSVLILFFSGLIIMSIGICGIYIGKIFEQTKKRPLYIVSKAVNLEPSSN